MAGTYKTPGRERLLRYFSDHPDRQYTADELFAALYPTEGGRGPKSSLYRHLSELVADGTVRRFRGDAPSSFVYQFVGLSDCSHHFHLKCTACGRIIHLECTVSDSLLSHIRSDHHFSIDSGRSILYGRCEGCEGNEGNAKDPFFEKKGSLDSTKKL